LFILFVIGHLVANYNAVKAVIMNTFNQNRFYILVKNYLNTGEILTPTVVNKMEPVLHTVKRIFSINLGCSMNRISNLNNSQLTRFSNDNYYISFDIKSISFSYFKSSVCMR
jgi:hypothetical protein